MLIQLPNDVKSVGYKQTKPFHHEQVFRSKSKNFEGTEIEFLEAGHGWAYLQIDNCSRIIISNKG